MQFVDGVSLERLASRRAMPLFRALRIVRELLKINRDCHAAGCQVGDIHSDNIILATGDRPFVIDLDLGDELNRRTVLSDIAAASRLFYYLNWDRGPYPPASRASCRDVETRSRRVTAAPPTCWTR
jgi:serine/threonine protein kinase